MLSCYKMQTKKIIKYPDVSKYNQYKTGSFKGLGLLIV